MSASVGSTPQGLIEESNVFAQMIPLSGMFETERFVWDSPLSSYANIPYCGYDPTGVPSRENLGRFNDDNHAQGIQARPSSKYPKEGSIAPSSPATPI